MLVAAILDVFVSRVPEEGGRYGECSVTSDMVHASRGGNKTFVLKEQGPQEEMWWWRRSVR